MMQPTDFRYPDHFTVFRQFDLTRERQVSIEGEMCSILVIISEVRTEDPLQMPFVEYDDMVETVAADSAVQAFNVRILPGRSWCRYDFFDAHVLDSLSKELAVDRVTISK